MSRMICDGQRDAKVIGDAAVYVHLAFDAEAASGSVRNLQTTKRPEPLGSGRALLIVTF